MHYCHNAAKKFKFVQQVTLLLFESEAYYVGTYLSSFPCVVGTLHCKSNELLFNILLSK